MGIEIWECGVVCLRIVLKKKICLWVICGFGKRVFVFINLMIRFWVELSYYNIIYPRNVKCVWFVHNIHMYVYVYGKGNFTWGYFCGAIIENILWFRLDIIAVFSCYYYYFFAILGICLCGIISLDEGFSKLFSYTINNYVNPHWCKIDIHRIYWISYTNHLIFSCVELCILSFSHTKSIVFNWNSNN